jgi:hypothetical protein
LIKENNSSTGYHHIIQYASGAFDKDGTVQPHLKCQTASFATTFQSTPRVPSWMNSWNLVKRRNVRTDQVEDSTIQLKRALSALISHFTALIAPYPPGVQITDCFILNVFIGLT